MPRDSADARAPRRPAALVMETKRLWHSQTTLRRLNERMTQLSSDYDRDCRWSEVPPTLLEGAGLEHWYFGGRVVDLWMGGSLDSTRTSTSWSGDATRPRPRGAPGSSLGAHADSRGPGWHQ